MIVSCGIDIIEVERIKKAIEEHQENFLEKVFCTYEIEYCEKKGKNKYQHYAARFAAKEAFVKAIGTGITSNIVWTDIGVINDINGKPEIKLEPKLKDCVKISSISLSISHCTDYAVANVVCVM